LSGASLKNGPINFIESRKDPLCDVPKMRFGSMPRDGGGFILTPEEKETFIKKEPLSQKWIKKYIGAAEFINNKDRYCLWMVNADPQDLHKCPMVMKRIEAVKEFRLASKAEGTRRFAKTPWLFCQIAQPDGDYLIVPKTSSGRREYLPIGFMDKNVIASDLVFLVPNASLYHFGVLNSRIHNLWMKEVAGRLKSDYRYSKDIVYNNFIWPETDEIVKEKISKTAQMILDARDLYPGRSLAVLYDPLTMPVELRKAHETNDKAVMKAYGFKGNESDDEILAKLFQLYQKIQSKRG